MSTSLGKDLVFNMQARCSIVKVIANCTSTHLSFPEPCVSISDNGPGVPASLRDTLFQPFVTTKDEGIGLGLAIAFDIMRQLGGDLLLDDTAHGACFTMVMPAP